MGPALSLLCGVLREDRSLVQALALLLCLVAQSCRALCDPGTVAHQDPLSMGFSQARILEWVAISPGDLPQHPSPPILPAVPYQLLSLPGVHDQQRGVLSIHCECPLVHIFCKRRKPGFREETQAWGRVQPFLTPLLGHIAPSTSP